MSDDFLYSVIVFGSGAFFGAFAVIFALRLW